MREIIVTACQLTPIAGDKVANINKIESMLEDVRSDLIVLPEFFSTGVDHVAFANSPEPPDGGATVRQLSGIAKKLHANIVCGSVIEKDGENFYNTSFLLDRDGKTVAKYRKKHLFNCFGGAEDRAITPGAETVVAELDFGKVGLSICFDIRYPEHFSELKTLGADVFVCPTAWGNTKSSEKVINWFEVWKSFNIARTNENLIPLVSANQIGTATGEFYSIGHSMITDKTGRILADRGVLEGVISQKIVI